MSYSDVAEQYFMSGPALVEGLGGIAGFGETQLGRGLAVTFVDISATFGSAGVTMFGHTVTGVYVANNGYIFWFVPGNTYALYAHPTDFVTSAGPSVPTSGGNSQGTNAVWVDQDPVNRVLTITWDDVQNASGEQEAFQIQFIADDAGLVSVIFRYEDIDLVSLGPAVYSLPNGYEYLASNVPMPLLDSTPGTDGIPGVYIARTWFDIIPPAAPTIDLDDESDSGSSNVDNLTKANQPILHGSAEAGAVVIVYDFGVEIGRTAADENGRWSWVATVLVDGNHRLTASALDAAGNASDPSFELVVSIDTTPPASPTAFSFTTSDAMPMLGGIAEPLSQLTISDTSGALVGTVRTGADGHWSLQAHSPLADGQHSFSVAAQDAAGNISAIATAIINIELPGVTCAGGTGQDTIIGTEGRDTLDGGNGDDVINGHRAPDEIQGGNGSDRLFGEGGADRLSGGRGDDFLTGGKGNDWISGGQGDDYLTGGEGADIFLLEHSGGADIIADFEVDIDLIDAFGLEFKKVEFSDVDQNGTVDAILVFSSSSVTILGLSDISQVFS